jgi:hypothetical protein
MAFIDQLKANMSDSVTENTEKLSPKPVAKVAISPIRAQSL